jgi:hypothetical protein
MSQGEYHQAMLERMQQLEEALDRAEAGCANEDDWKVIRFECGLPTKVNHKLGVKNEFNSISKWWR